MPSLHSCCEGSTASIFPFFIHLHRVNSNLEFERLFESFWQVATDLWHKEDKISGCFKNSSSFVLEGCQNQVNGAKEGFSVVFQLFQDLKKVESVLLKKKKHHS